MEAMEAKDQGIAEVFWNLCLIDLILFLLSPGKMLLFMSLNQDCLQPL